MNQPNDNESGRGEGVSGSGNEGLPDPRRAEAVASMLAFLGETAPGADEAHPVVVDPQELVNALLQDFDDEWRPGALAVELGRLPTTGPLRRLGLTRLVKIDLRKRWERGDGALLEEYLAMHPELGTPADVAPDLVWAEWQARKACGALDRDDFHRRFPKQAAILGPRDPDTIGAAATVTPSPIEAPSVESRPGAGELSGQFGRYRIEKKLGEGGMGAVYLAHDTTLDRHVALKVPQPSVTARAEGRERFLREARAASSLSHPNLCPVYDFGEIDGAYYLAMAYVEGKPLSDLLRGAGPLPPREVAALVRKLALAMQEAHQKGVIHRDLKPANILITPRHEPVITDFGLARRGQDEEGQLTRDGDVMGTPAYMAPEQASGATAQAGPSSDIYSLGVVLYELLTGKRPFAGQVVALLYAHVHQPPAPPSSLRPGLDPGLEAVCLKALAKRPQDRHASMGEFAEALRTVLEGGKVAVADAGQPPPLPTQAAPGGAEGMTSHLMAELLARLDRPARPPVHYRWAWAGLAVAVLILGGAVVYILARPNSGEVHQTNVTENYVTVQLVGVIVNVNVHETNIVYVLNGEPVAPEKLRGQVSLPLGRNELVVKRGDEVIETRVFDVGAGDEGGKVEVPAEEVPTVSVRLKLPPMDEGETGLRFVLDGKAVSPGSLKEKLTLRRGLHELIVLRGGQELGRHVFGVAAADADKEVVVPGGDYRRVAVTLVLTNVKASEAAVVLLDGVPISAKELEKPLRLLPGPHEVVVIDRDGEARKTFHVARGDKGEQRIEVAARPEAPGPAVKVPPSRALELILPLTKDADAKVRKEAMDKMAALDEPAVVPTLCALLEDKDPGVRVAAAEWLEKKGDRGAVHALVRRVADGNWYIPRIHGEEDPDKGGKGAALKALRKLGKPEEVTAALIAALTGAEGHQRHWALLELGKQADRARAAPALRKLVVADNWYDPKYRRDDDKTRDVDPDWGGKGEALKMLRELAPEQVTGALLEAMRGKLYAMRLWATRELGAQNDPADRTQIVDELKKRVADELWYDREYTNVEPDPKGGGKAEALRLLRSFAHDEALEPLTKALFSKHADQRTWAARELAAQNDKKAIPALKRRLADDTWDEGTSDNKKDGHGKIAALQAIRDLDPKEVEKAIEEALKSKNSEVKKWALSQVGTRKDDKKDGGR